MGLERRGRADQVSPGQPGRGGAAGDTRPQVKPFEIDKRLIYRAWEKVRANKGAPGVDAVSIGLFEQQWRDNRYKLWNRMSSGSYFPGPVRGVEIPKDHGEGVRLLGVPNTADRVAQTAAAMVLEAKLEPVFHPGGYGYRPGRSAHDALAVCRQRCWKQDWVLDLDIRAFFDSVPHSLLLKAVLTTPASDGSCSTSPGGWLRRCRCRTGPSSRGRREPHRVPRSRPFWPTCSCTMRSTCGWTGSSRAARSSATRTTVCRERDWRL